LDFQSPHAFCILKWPCRAGARQLFRILVWDIAHFVSLQLLIAGHNFALRRPYEKLSAPIVSEIWKGTYGQQHFMG